MLSWFQGKKDVNQLIARGQYPKAIKQLEKLLRENPKSAHLRKVLADVLHRDGQRGRAIEVLEGLVQEYSSEGFVTKAIAVLKKIQRIDPEQSDAEVMLETLAKIRSKDKPPRGQDRAPFGLPQRPAPAPQEEAAEGMENSIIMPPEFWFEEAAQRRDGFNWSPLFSEFSRDELAAMIGGLRLLIKRPGSIIYTEGEPGNSLFVLSSGSARVYRKDSVGHNQQVAMLGEGGVFGTPSVLSGAPRGRTIIAVGECELLELEKATFENIASAHPRVNEMLQKLHEGRR